MTRILVAGDFCANHRVHDLIENERYDEVFGSIRQFTEKSDYSILNFECPVVLESASQIKKVGPNLKCTYKAVNAIKYAGFQLATLANNHIFDYGDVGISNTISYFKYIDIDIVGIGENITQAEQTFYKDLNGEKFAFINFCENEFSIASNTSGGANPLNPISNYYQISEARKIAKYIILIVHGGHENYQLPSPRMKETYRFFIDAGADVVLNHHQHCYSGYEIYQGKPIFYGLGNFSFDWPNIRNDAWNEGIMVNLVFDDGKISFEIIPIIQGNENSGVILANENERNSIISKIHQLNKIIDDQVKLNIQFDKLIDNNNRTTLLIFEPYNSRYLIALRMLKLLPSFVNKKKLLKIKNKLLCESHRDLIISTLRKNA